MAFLTKADGFARVIDQSGHRIPALGIEYSRVTGTDRYHVSLLQNSWGNGEAVPGKVREEGVRRRLTKRLFEYAPIAGDTYSRLREKAK